MIQYNSVNAKLSYLQFNKFKSSIKNAKEVTLRFSLNVIGLANYETNQFSSSLKLLEPLQVINQLI